MGSETKEERNTAEYLAQLLKDKKQVQAFPNVFIHLDRLLDDEINKVRVSLFNLEKKPLVLPDPACDGVKITLTEKLYVPVREHPDFNFVGRILGPRGITAKQLERDTGCKIMVRGKGSMRDKKKEDQMRGKPNWEHLSEDLHVLIMVEDTEKRASIKMSRALEDVKKLLVPAPEGEDDLKKIQLMELAIMNGTYRDTKVMAAAVQQAAAVVSTASGLQSYPYITAADQQLQQLHEMQQRMLGAPLTMQQTAAGLRAAATAAAAAAAGTPIILSPHHRQMTQQQSQTQQQFPASLGPPPLVSPNATTAGTAEAGFFYTLPAEYAQFAAFPTATQMFDYAGLDLSAAGAISKMRRRGASFVHPYQRV